MRLVFHPDVYSDIEVIMRYYEQVATPELADRFYPPPQGLRRDRFCGGGYSVFPLRLCVPGRRS